MVLVAQVIGLAVGDLGGVTQLGEDHRNLAGLAQHRQGLLVEAVAFVGLLAPVVPAWLVNRIKSLRVLLRQPGHFALVRNPGVQGRCGVVVVKHGEGLVADVVLAFTSLYPALGLADAVAGQILEQGFAVFLDIHFPALAPAHHALGQHVVLHHRDDAEQAVAAPEPFVDPALHDGHVGRVLFQHEFDALNAQRHVARLVGLCAETEGHGGHVAVVRRARHKGHEQQVGQYVFKREADGGQELERAAGVGVFKEGLRHRQIPNPVKHVLRAVQAVEVLVVVAERVGFGLVVAQLVNRLHLAGHAGTGTGELAPRMGKTTVGVVLQRRDAGQKQLERIDVARIGDAELAVVLGEGLDHRIQLFLFFALVFPVGVHRQAKRVFPLVPVVNLDALVFVIRKDLVHRLVGSVPGEVARHGGVAVFQTELFLDDRGVHFLSPDGWGFSASSSARTGRRLRRCGPRA